jgi:hypothetical protein
MDTNNNDKKMKKTRVKKAISTAVVDPNPAVVDSNPAVVDSNPAVVDSNPAVVESLPPVVVVEPKAKKTVKRVKKVKEAVKIIQELNDKDNHSEDNDDKEKEKENEDDEKKSEDKESNIVTEKTLDVSGTGEEKELYGYLIIQEFPHINTTYVIGSKPFGKIWFDYTEVLEQFITILIDWQVDFDNTEIVHSKKPRIVKIRVF